MSLSANVGNSGNYIEELPNGFWNQRKALLERRLKGKKGRTGQFNNPLGILTEEPIQRVFDGHTDSYVKSITITPLQYGNKNLPRTPICVRGEGSEIESCLNRAWEKITTAWGTYWNQPAPGTSE